VATSPPRGRAPAGLSVGSRPAILVSAAVIKSGDDGTDQFIARQTWLYV
jgi:hypothetical protein